MHRPKGTTPTLMQLFRARMRTHTHLYNANLEQLLKVSLYPI